jgi:hypothetical protein
VCLDAALHRALTPSAQLRCTDDLTVLVPKVGRSAAAKACLVTSDMSDLCEDCLLLRRERRCPTWPAPRRR